MKANEERKYKGLTIQKKYAGRKYRYFVKEFINGRLIEEETGYCFISCSDTLKEIKEKIDYITSLNLDIVVHI